MLSVICAAVFLEPLSVVKADWVSLSSLGNLKKTPNLWFHFLLIFVLFSVYFVTGINRLRGEKYIFGLCIALIVYELLIVG